MTSNKGSLDKEMFYSLFIKQATKKFSCRSMLKPILLLGNSKFTKKYDCGMVLHTSFLLLYKILFDVFLNIIMWYKS